MNGNGSHGYVSFGVIAATVLLLASCDKAPTRPDDPTPGPSPAARSTGPIAFVSNRDGADAIYLANEDGSAITRLTDGFQPAWSRDGRRIAFSRAWNVYLINVDGSGLRWVTTGIYPSWSPDGNKLVFGDGSVFVIDANGSNRQEIFDDHGYLTFGTVWSPDGRRIAFSVGTYDDVFNDLFGLWIVGPDGTGAERPLVEAGSPAWSPDSSQIAFLNGPGIGVVNADGTGERLQVAAPNISNVDWTSNGSLVYSRWITESHEGPSRIFISDGGTERQLVPDATAPARQVYRDWHVVWRR